MINFMYEQGFNRPEEKKKTNSVLGSGRNSVVTGKSKEN